MKKSQGQVVCTVISFEDEKYIEKEVAIPLQDGVPGLGMPITRSAADKMINTYIAANMNNLDQNLSIEFGRETLLYLFSQTGCESLKFYFCINHMGQKSLVAVPMQAGGDQILLKNANGDEIAGSEVGGGTSIREFLLKNKGFKPGEFSLLK